MPLTSLLIRLAMAIGLSATVLAVLILLQGMLLFSEHIESLNSPERATIHRFQFLRDSHSAVVLLRRSDRDDRDSYPNFAGVWSFDDSGHALRPLPFDVSPHNVVVARDGRRLFASAKGGQVYVFDFDSPAAQPRLLGIHDEGFMRTLECTHDGSIVIGTNRRILGAWTSDPPCILWRRDDLDVTSACFLGQTSRLLCGLINGDVCELDGLTGATLRTITTYGSYPVSIDTSPVSSQPLAALGLDFLRVGGGITV